VVVYHHNERCTCGYVNAPRNWDVNYHTWSAVMNIAVAQLPVLSPTPGHDAQAAVGGTQQDGKMLAAGHQFDASVAVCKAYDSLPLPHCALCRRDAMLHHVVRAKNMNASIMRNESSAAPSAHEGVRRHINKRALDRARKSWQPL
jgi:hypothetical protein